MVCKGQLRKKKKKKKEENKKNKEGQDGEWRERARERDDDDDDDHSKKNMGAETGNSSRRWCIAVGASRGKTQEAQADALLPGSCGLDGCAAAGKKSVTEPVASKGPCDGQQGSFWPPCVRDYANAPHGHKTTNIKKKKGRKKKKK
jgi:hypothetical protein